ncbi:MAG: hypothetical protein JSR60_20170 [Proteobacteria bacterium]|nr:hypothetical protein [Pseudomonadota bacterium]
MKNAIPARPALRLPGSASRPQAYPLIHADPAAVPEAYARNTAFEPENSQICVPRTAAAWIADAMMAPT